MFMTIPVGVCREFSAAEKRDEYLDGEEDRRPNSGVWRKSNHGGTEITEELRIADFGLNYRGSVVYLGK